MDIIETYVRSFSVASVLEIKSTAFPTHSFICGGPPQYQHCPPHVDFPICRVAHLVQSLRQRVRARVLTISR